MPRCSNNHLFVLSTAAIGRASFHSGYTQVTSRCRIQSDLSVFNSRKMCVGMADRSEQQHFMYNPRPLKLFLIATISGNTIESH
ncbi:Hypothetical protein PBPRA2205 [Photobacterium profundum SS9]|uniref:Uncharacterized protein n=1 Tax=Photobacterium profundum (strain SS9) TaxID=298386 RepID=Q6LQ25_PHOPR|nr:Hypothetical protein PBPRA2205 [Photobacterium profundum SS9]